MELLVLNENFEYIYVIDAFKSLIWTDRYDEYGDFELVVLASSENITKFKIGYYLLFSGSDRAMIIEDIDVNIDSESESVITLTGKSLESILERRIVWTQTTVTGYLQTCIKKLLNENIISPSKSQRAISNFTFEESDDESIAELSISSAQFTGDTVYEAIQSLCQKFNCGFKVTLNSDKQFVFKVFIGKDRSYCQLKNPYVIFSEEINGLSGFEYKESHSAYKNVALVGGEGEGSERTFTTSGDDSAEGLNRYELFVDAKDLSSDSDGSSALTNEEYSSQLTQRGDEKLKECETTIVCDGEISNIETYTYGKDFYVGDIIQVESLFGIEAYTRITEYIYSADTSGYRSYPTFEEMSTITILSCENDNLITTENGYCIVI